ncbi:MAG: hypothetical protein AVDCRST_MAG79-1991, partial [uncultured Thermoleophilia bacterium]
GGQSSGKSLPSARPKRSRPAPRRRASDASSRRARVRARCRPARRPPLAEASG